MSHAARKIISRHSLLAMEPLSGAGGVHTKIDRREEQHLPSSLVGKIIRANSLLASDI